MSVLRSGSTAGWRIGIGGLVAMSLLSLVMRAQAQTAQQIPDTRAQTLAGNTIHLPADLHGKTGVLILGFSKASSAQCRAWYELINRDFASDGRATYYEMPVLQDVPGMFRGMVIRGIRNGLPAAVQSRFVPLVQNEAVWKGLAQFGAEDDAYVLIIDDAGVVKWRTHGEASAAAYATFKASLAAAEK